MNMRRHSHLSDQVAVKDCEIAALKACIAEKTAELFALTEEHIKCGDSVEGRCKEQDSIGDGVPVVLRGSQEAQSSRTSMSMSTDVATLLGMDDKDLESSTMKSQVYLQCYAVDVLDPQRGHERSPQSNPLMLCLAVLCDPDVY